VGVFAKGGGGGGERDGVGGIGKKKKKKKKKNSLQHATYLEAGGRLGVVGCVTICVV